MKKKEQVIMPHSVTWRILAVNCELSGAREALPIFVHHKAQNGARSQLHPIAATDKIITLRQGTWHRTDLGFCQLH